MARESTSGSETWRRREFIEKLTTLRQMNPELPRSVSNESQIPPRSPESVSSPPSLPAPGIPHSWGIIAVPDSLPRMGFDGLPAPVRGRQTSAEPVSTACAQPLHQRVIPAGPQRPGPRAARNLPLVIACKGIYFLSALPLGGGVELPL